MSHSSRDLLKLENEYRNELPQYKEKPNISAPTKPVTLGKVSKFLAAVKSDTKGAPTTEDQPKSNDQFKDRTVEMNIIISSMEQTFCQ